jgi:regulator of sigma E protease
MLGISTIILFLLLVSLMTVGHELGHFLVARFFGLQTPVFGLGLPWGPSWVIGHKWDTQVRVHLLLFGGYVSIPELDSAPPDETSRAKPLRHFPLWQRILVVLAGVGFYIMFAWMALFISLNAAGEPNQRVVVQDLSPTNPIAASAGVKRGDLIVAIDSKQVSSPDEIVSCLRSHPATPVIIRVLRQEHELELPITSDSGGKVGMSLGIDVSSSYRRIGFVECFGRATHNLYKMTTDIYRATGRFSKARRTSKQPDQRHQEPSA